MIADDFLYSFYLTPVAAKSFFEGSFVGFEQKIGSVSDVFCSQFNHYFYVNGRTIPHLIEQLFAGILGKENFNFLNVLFFLLLNMLVVWMSGREYVCNFSYWIAAFFFLWFLLPYPADIALPMGCAVNYVWSSVFCLVFLLVYHRVKRMEKVNWLVTIFLFLLGLVAGWTHEALVIGISGALFICYYMHYRRPKAHEIVMVVGFWLGTLLVCLSPAARGRALFDHPSVGETLFVMASELRGFYVFVFLLCCVPLCGKKNRNISVLKNFIRDNRFYFYVILIEFSFSLFIGYRNVRQLFGIELFFVVLSMKLISYLVSPISIRFRLFSILVAILIVIHMACVVPYAKCSHMQFQNLVESYMQSEDGVVYFRQETFPWLLDPYVWRFGEHVDWGASCISVYYTGNKKPMKVLLVNDAEGCW